MGPVYYVEFLPVTEVKTPVSSPNHVTASSPARGHDHKDELTSSVKSGKCHIHRQTNKQVNHQRDSYEILK